MDQTQLKHFHFRILHVILFSLLFHARHVPHIILQLKNKLQFCASVSSKCQKWKCTITTLIHNQVYFSLNSNLIFPPIKSILMEVPSSAMTFALTLTRCISLSGALRGEGMTSWDASDGCCGRARRWSSHSPLPLQSSEREGDNLHHPPPLPYDPNLPPPQEPPPRPTATSRWNTSANSFPHAYFRPRPPTFPPRRSWWCGDTLYTESTGW